MLKKSLKIIIREKSVKYLFYSLLFGFVAYHGRYAGMLGRVFGGKKVKWTREKEKKKLYIFLDGILSPKL